MTERVQINLRLPEDVHLELKRVAEIEKRSVNNLIEYIIDQYLKKYEQ